MNETQNPELPEELHITVGSMELSREAFEKYARAGGALWAAIAGSGGTTQPSKAADPHTTPNDTPYTARDLLKALQALPEADLDLPIVYNTEDGPEFPDSLGKNVINKYDAPIIGATGYALWL